MLGAILLVGERRLGHQSADFAADRLLPLAGPPFACMEILGSSLLERTLSRFHAAGIERLSVLVQESTLDSASNCQRLIQSSMCQVVADLGPALATLLQQYAQSGVDDAFVTDLSAYSECDLAALASFHRAGGRPSTAAFNREGALGLWVIDCKKVSDDYAEINPDRLDAQSSTYFVHEYARRMTEPADIRALVIDAFKGRNQVRPSGVETRPGVWLDENSEVHKRARIVAPAYIGRGAEICEDTVVTRFSNIEKECCVDYGTVIENSSVLMSSYVGIWLDVSHAVIQGNTFFSVSRNVALTISDPSVIRENFSRQKEGYESIKSAIASTPIAVAAAEVLGKSMF